MLTRRKWYMTALTVLLAAMLALAGCSAGNDAAEEPGNNTEAPDNGQPEANPPAPVAPDPVTLNFFNRGEGVISQAKFEEWIQSTLKEKHPHITINYISPSTNITQLVTSGTIPDLIYAGLGSIPEYHDLGLLGDMTPLARQHSFDFSRVEDSALETIRSYSPEGHLYAIPLNINSVSLLYNKDLFDRFGVDYPKDNMTYDEIYDVARLMTRMEDGVQYRGIDFTGHLLNYNQLGLSFIDSSEKAAVNTNEWQTYVQNYARFYQIPGNQLVNLGNGNMLNQFFVNKTLAMLTSANSLSNFVNNEAVEQSVNWDMVTVPSFSHQRGVGSSAFLEYLVVTGTSPHKDAAFLVVEHALSEAVQTSLSREGLYPALKNQSVRDQFMQAYDFAAGKNVKAFYALTPAPSRTPTLYDAEAIRIIDRVVRNPVYQGTTDVNTALRQAEEEINQHIAAVKAR